MWITDREEALSTALESGEGTATTGAAGIDSNFSGSSALDAFLAALQGEEAATGQTSSRSPGNNGGSSGSGGGGAGGDTVKEVLYLRIDPERQRLLRNMGVPALVLTLLQNGYAMLLNRRNASRTTAAFMKGTFRIFAHCYRFLRTFVSGVPSHQESLSAHTGLFVHLLSQNLFGADLLADLVANNVQLCRDVSWWWRWCELFIG